jgi:hypothetical protein
MLRLLAFALPILASAAHAAPACRVDDAYADFLRRAQHAAGADDETRLAALRDFVSAHAGLYTAEATGMVPGPELDRAGLREMAAGAAGARAADFDAEL